MNIKAIVFDVDDTLTQSMKCKWQGLQKTARKFYGVDLTRDTIKKFWGLPFEEMILKMIPQASDLNTITQQYLEVTREFPMTAQDNGPALINKLKKQYLLAALTSSSREFIIKDLEDAGYRMSDFIFIQTSEDTNFHKPDPRVFLFVTGKLSKRNINTPEILYAGDSLLDFKAARGAGIQFIAVTTGLVSKEDFIIEGVEKENIISDLSALKDAINAL